MVDDYTWVVRMHRYAKADSDSKILMNLRLLIFLDQKMVNNSLIGGLEHGFYFSIYLTIIFFRGVGILPTSQ